MKCWITLVALAAVLGSGNRIVLADPPLDPFTQQDFMGRTWMSVTLERDGKERAYLRKEFWKFTDQGVVRWSKEAIEEKYDSFSVDLKAKPMTFDLIRQEADGKRTVVAGVLERTANLTFVWVRDTAPQPLDDKAKPPAKLRRPASIQTHPGDKFERLLIVSAYEPDDEKPPAVERGKK